MAEPRQIHARAELAADTSEAVGPTVGDVGEDRVLAAVRAVIDAHNAEEARAPGLALPPGDDAAVLRLASTEAVLSTDTMAEGQDFRLSWWPDPVAAGRAVGQKAAAQNLSDLNAMGAEPLALLVSCTLPAELPLAAVSALAEGLTAACRAPGAARCVVAGGDLGSGPGLAVTITAVGEPWHPEPEAAARPLRRDGARPGDVLAIGGPLGRAAAGLALIEAGVVAADARPMRGQSPQEALLAACAAAQAAPGPDLTLGPAAVRAGASAGLDVSDGLLRDAGRLAAASDVALDLDEAALEEEIEPLRRAAETLRRRAPGARPDPRAWVLSGGEDYALLATFGAVADLPEGFRRIGTVRAHDGAPGVDAGGSVESTGWDSLGG
ncbi:thiamine-phosphate kinase [Nesterenkonia sp. F]|uniref:thiamine-phosphate kinase n=1 Tax=Nesterenkonia sp. F TaxID=795955 RepID=UPI000255CD2C|nr:thiamine-phosphate kinase [Nesterenkonia sp. F]